MATQEITAVQRLFAFALLAITTSLTTLIAPDAFALDSKPHVVVNFEIVAPAFDRNLPQRDAAEKNIGTELAQQIAERYAFADWTIVPRDNQARLGTLLLRLEEEPNTVPNPRIVVTWHANFGASTASPTELAIAPTEIYEPTNPNWDTNSRRNFETRVLDRLAVAMRTDSFYDVLFKTFVRNLPIASSVTAQSGDHAIDVPVSWREILLAPESVVVVRFRKKVGTTSETGSLRLNPVTARVVMLDPTTQSTATSLRGAVNNATYGVQTLDLVRNWNDTLPELLRDAEVRCYIVDYKPLEFAGTNDGLVLDPTQ